jgi:hypothetical protein
VFFDPAGGPLQRAQAANLLGWANQLHRRFPIVMAGLFPAIHVFDAPRKKDVNARHKAGHDEPVRATDLKKQTERAARPV